MQHHCWEHASIDNLKSINLEGSVFKKNKVINLFGLITRKNAKAIYQYKYQQGFKDGKNSQKITFNCIKQDLPYDAKSASEYLVPPTGMGITEDLSEEIVKNFSSEFPPTLDQKRVILSDSRNIRVVAGAGSGKSSTLVQRLVVLHRDLKIPLDEITVFSFTRASCAEFRSKMIKEFEKSGINVSNEKAKKVVRTFHSKVREFNRILARERKPFEFLGNDDTELDDDLGTLRTKLNPPQITLLKEHYRDCFEHKPLFREKVKELILEVARKRVVKEEDQKTAQGYIKNIVERDEKYAMRVHGCLSINEGMLDKPQAMEFSDHENKNWTLFYNAYIKNHNLYVIFTHNFKYLEELGLDPKQKNKVSETKVVSLHLASKNKYSLIHSCGDANVLCLSRREDVDLLNLTIAASKEKFRFDPSVFSLKLEGDIVESQLLEQFSQVGSFIESVGLDVKDILSSLSNPRNGLSQHDRLFAELLVLFWQDWDQFLEKRRIVRFHTFFENFSHEEDSSFSDVDEKTLISMSNLMIDEFQDISAEAVRWIRSCLYALRIRQHETSLVCVGDDYQSIYGWRGAAPSYLINYKTHFPSKKLDDVQMNENFRSYQSIVDAGENALVSVRNRIPKHGDCENDSPDACHVEVLDSTLDQAENEKYLVDSAENKVLDLIDQFGKLPSEIKENTDKYILVLSRTNKTINRIRKAINDKFDKPLPENCISYETFHRSKGLEAEHCVLLEDCAYDLKNPLRNLIYERSGNFDETYDRAQTEESKRLAYVAMTRAKKSFWWFGFSKEGGSIEDTQKYLESKHSDS